jgi:hypothetical protein
VECMWPPLGRASGSERACPFWETDSSAQMKMCLTRLVQRKKVPGFPLCPSRTKARAEGHPFEKVLDSAEPFYVFW